MENLRPSQPISQIYIEGAKQALILAKRADHVAATSTDKTTKAKAEEISIFCNRFAKKAQKAAEQTITTLNEGALKDFCQRFDLIFERFVVAATAAEKILDEQTQK